MKIKQTIPLFISVLCIATVPLSHASMSFSGLGYLPGGSYPYCEARDVSADGSVVVGYSGGGVFKAFRWTQSAGMSYLGDLPGNTTYSIANGVSADGETIVGSSYGSGGQQAFRWTQSGGMVGLGDLAGGNWYGIADKASSDGSTIVGYSSSVNGYEAFRWTQSGGMVGLGDLAGGSFYSIGEDVSGDGSVVVGYGTSTSGTEAFRWTSGGMVGLGVLAGGTVFSRAFGVSSDGSTIVGYSSSVNGNEAFRWTQTGGMIGLGDLPGSTFSSLAKDVSGDGSVVVGRASSTNGTEVFVWDEANGMQSLKSILEEGGIDMSDWVLDYVGGISDDGNTVVGWGLNPAGESQAFVANISGWHQPVLAPGEIVITGNAGSISDGGSTDFGNHAVGMSKVRTFRISNDATGDATSLSDFSITKNGADAAAFTVGAISAGSLGNGQSTTFRVTFIPTSATAHSAAIHILSNDEDESPFDINLSGTGLANSDSEPGSDAWETANGFAPNIYDFYTLDSDGDGISDIREIYFGWSRFPSFPLRSLAVGSALEEPQEGSDFFNVQTSSNGVLKVQYRRSTTQTALIAHPVWTSNLSSNEWKYSGESDLGAVVTVSETVVSNGVDFEIVESSAEVTSGDTGALFFTLKLSPNE